MPLPDFQATVDSLRDYIWRDVAAAFDTPETIITAIVDLLQPEYDPVVLRPYAQQVVESLLKQHRARQATWSTVTDCDRLDRAFAHLEASGIVCRQHFTCCSRCGEAEILNELASLQAGGQLVRGYAFYDVRETDAAILGHGLHLSFGAATRDLAAAHFVGQKLVSTLEQQGLRTDWTGEPSSRIFVDLDWKRRRGSSAFCSQVDG
ncbi:MAG: hypothetical protein HXY37_16210 [Chloroflexi bacterium]|nr:hypothetical protein [Chloroflexota bacterium]